MFHATDDAVHRDLLLGPICSLEIGITTRKPPAEATSLVEICTRAVLVVKPSYTPAEEFELPMIASAGFCKAVHQVYGSIGVYCNRLLRIPCGHVRHQKRNPETLDLVDKQVGYMEETFL